MATGPLVLINQEIALGLQIGNTLIPIIKGAVTAIKKILTPQGVVEYTVVITTDQGELLDVATVSIADLIAINTELKAQGATALPVPAPPATPVP